jgi:type IV secretion system protein VirB9
MANRFLFLSSSCAALLTGMVFAGCAALRLPARTSSPGPQPALVQAQPVADPPATPVTPPSTTTLLDELPADVRDAMTKYTASGKAPLIDKRKEAGFLRFPYGLSQPVVLCRTDTLCDIELEPGEEVLDLGAADTVRWQFQLLREGPAEHRTVHVLIKPQDSIPMETGLVIGTTRRVYRVKVKSGGPATVNVKFYYPEDLVRHFTEQQAQAAADTTPVVAKLPDVSIEDLHQNYQVSGDAPFRPTWVADDGKRTYLKMPEGITATSAPALYVERPNGDKAIVNYTARLPYYVVHGLFERAFLQVGTGRDAQQVTIIRQ